MSAGRRWGLGRGAALALLGLLAGCAGVDADERFARDGRPAVAALAEGVVLRAHPARIRIDAATGEAVVRAASPQLWLELETESARRAALVVENLPSAVRFAPAPAAVVSAGPTAWRLELELQPGVTRLETVAEPAGALRFAVLSDLHVNLDSLRAIGADLAARRPELLVCLGDLSDRGTAKEIDQLFAPLAALGVPVYSTLGNHEIFGDAAERFDERLGPANLSFLWRGTRFVLVDSSETSIARAAWAWLDAQLAASPGQAFVFTHVPPLDASGVRNHSFRIRDEGLRFSELLAARGAAGLFVGHVHEWERYELAGVPVHLTGGAGEAREWLTGIGLHYAEVEVRPGEAPVVSRREIEP